MSKSALLSPSVLHQTNFRAREPLALNHSWPVSERARYFEMGSILSSAVIDAIQPEQVGDLGFLHVGCWECDLSDNSLLWSGGVYDLFGMPRGVAVSRKDAVALYSEESRAAMERLRSYAIKHARGFTIDTEIRPFAGKSRWMRLIAAPVCEDGVVTRLHGLKLSI